jgi:hypothetical protein
MRTFQESIVNDSTWLEVREGLGRATNEVEVLSVDERARGPAKIAS